MDSGYLANLRHVAVSNSCGWDRPEFVFEWKRLGDRISALAGNETTFITKGTNEVEVGMFSFDD